VSKLQHPDSRSFERVAELYERRRPEYPDDAVAWLAERLDLRAGRAVLDLGAGTGKLARALVETDARVIALEPGEAMLGQLARAVPQAEPLLGAAEAIPLPDESVDAVACGQSFHWFRAAEALTEIHRVLRPHGGLALIWNMRDQKDPLQRRITALLEPFVPSRRPRSSSSADTVEGSRLFGPVETRSFRHAQTLDAEGLAERIATISFVAAAPAADRAELDRVLRGLAAARGGEVSFRYVTRAFVAFSVA
jgi:ubiquinone/menaquinone biosynthesis C-methylase UbiE